jgi:hypothetical protein
MPPNVATALAFLFASDHAHPNERPLPVGEEDGTTVRDISFKLDSGPQLVRAGDGWVIVNADGDTYPPALAVSP